MKQIRLLLVPVTLALAAVAVTATAQASSSERSGAVYTLTNAPSGNAIAVFDRDAHGALTPAGTFATGGSGTGANLGSQGALAISADPVREPADSSAWKLLMVPVNSPTPAYSTSNPTSE